LSFSYCVSVTVRLRLSFAVTVTHC